MLPDPANPRPDNQEKSGTLVPGVISIGITLAVAILAHRLAKKANTLPDNSISDGQAESQPGVLDIATTGNPIRDLEQTAASKPTIQRAPFLIDIHRSRVDYAALGISFLSLVATVVIAIFAGLINWKQAEILEKQAKSLEVQSAAATDEVNISFVEEFRERLTELSLPTDDPNKPGYEENLMRKSLATIALARVAGAEDDSKSQGPCSSRQRIRSPRPYAIQ
jgi:hypothetical protein